MNKCASCSTAMISWLYYSCITQPVPVNSMHFIYKTSLIQIASRISTDKWISEGLFDCVPSSINACAIWKDHINIWPALCNGTQLKSRWLMKYAECWIKMFEDQKIFLCDLYYIMKVSETLCNVWFILIILYLSVQLWNSPYMSEYMMLEVI